MNRILSIIFAVSFITILGGITLHKAYGDGFSVENLPPATIGDNKVSLFIKINPTIITNNANQQKYLQLRVFDANTNKTLPHDSLLISITRASNDQQLLLRELFHSHSGLLTLAISPSTNSKWIVNGNQDPVLGWLSLNDSPIPVTAPILGEGGLYHIHISLLSYLTDRNIFAPQDIPTFDSYLSVGNISNQTIIYKNNSYNTAIISYYDKLNNDFNFDSSKLQISFSMPFDWDPTRFEYRPIFVHEEVHIPKAFKEFTNTPTFVASVNGIPIQGSRLIVDPYSLGDSTIVHILLNKLDIQNFANTIPSGTSTMSFQLSPATANVQSSSSMLTDFGGWKIKLGWSPITLNANSVNSLRLTFFDALSGEPLSSDVNYDFKILANDGSAIVSKTDLVAKGGIDMQSINLPGNGIYRIEANVKSIVNNGISDTTRIGVARGDLVIPSTVINDETNVQTYLNQNIPPAQPSQSIPPAQPSQSIPPAQPSQSNSPLVQTATLPNCGCVAFRLEFVQDHYLNNVQDAIINTFQQKGASLTIGLLGKDIGANPKVVGLIKDRLRDNNPPIELANHGWDNLDHTQYAKDEQSASIKMSGDKISRIFGVTPTIFIPPFNKFNNDTITAVQENGIKYISSSVSADPGPYNIHNAILFHLPQTTLLSYLLEDDPFFRGGINDKALAKIRIGLNQTGFSVVTIRTQDFAVPNGDAFNNQVDAQKIQSLESLLDFLQSNGIKTVTIDQIPQMETAQKSPKWTNNLYTWYQTGQISYDEIISAIDYLVEQNIIKTN